MNFKLEIKINWDFINVYVNEILFIQIPNLREKICIQTYRDVSTVTKWCIDFYNFETGVLILTSEFDSVEKWEMFLKEWDKKINKST